jgi:ABC-type transport system involved in multi-copper enzyme maturation permease subunit
MMRSAMILARKEAGELLLNPRGMAWLLALAAVLSGFSLLLVSSAELSLLDNATVVYDMAGIVTGLGALLAIVTGADAIGGERERGSLVPLLVAPLPRGALLLGKLAGLATAWVAAYALALPYLWAAGSTGQNLAHTVMALPVFGTPLVLGFAFLAFGLGARLRSTRTALLTGLILLVLAAAPVALGPGLRQTAVGRVFDTLNPLSHALNAFDAIIIDSLGLASQGWHLAALAVWFGATLWFAGASLKRGAFMEGTS